ncbi:MAG: hypothetical protein ACJ79H_15295 [Myxococcales bacterium]
MDQHLKPCGEVVAEHRASVAWRITSVVLLALPGAMLLSAAWSGPRENALAVSIPGAVLIAACVLVFVQQAKVAVVLRTDGLERWGVRGELWTLRWEDAAQLRYQATRVHAVGLDLFLLLKLFPALGKSVKIGFVDVGGKRRNLPSSLKAMDLLAERVIEHHTAAQFPVLRSALDRGEEVRFGNSLSLDREQVSVRKLFGGSKRCLLSDVEKVGIRRRQAQDPPERQDLRIRKLRGGQGAERLSLREALRLGAPRHGRRHAGARSDGRRDAQRRLIGTILRPDRDHEAVGAARRERPATEVVRQAEVASDDRVSAGRHGHRKRSWPVGTTIRRCEGQREEGVPLEIEAVEVGDRAAAIHVEPDDGYPIRRANDQTAGRDVRHGDIGPHRSVGAAEIGQVILERGTFLQARARQGSATSTVSLSVLDSPPALAVSVKLYSPLSPCCGAKVRTAPSSVANRGRFEARGQRRSERTVREEATSARGPSE